MAGIGVQDHRNHAFRIPESAFTMDRNRCSRWIRKKVCQDLGPEYAMRKWSKQLWFQWSFRKKRLQACNMY